MYLNKIKEDMKHFQPVELHNTRTTSTAKED